MYPPFVQCFNFQNSSLGLLSNFILPETSEAGIITPIFSLGQRFIKDKVIATTQRDRNSGLIVSKWGFSHHLTLFGLDTQVFDPFSLAIHGMTTVSLLVGVGHSELCPLC